MKRREMLRLISVSFAGLAGASTTIRASEVQPDSHCTLGPEPLAIQYTKKVRERLTWIRQTQTEDLMEDAALVLLDPALGGEVVHLAAVHIKTGDIEGTAVAAAAGTVMLDDPFFDETF